MASKFVTITHDEMWSALNAISTNLPKGSYINSISGTFAGAEEAYEIVLTEDQSIIVYTSIRRGNRISRDLGKDAIRLVLATTEHPKIAFSNDIANVVHHKRICRIYRTEGWQIRLQNRIYEAIETEKINDAGFKPMESTLMPVVEQETCCYCGDPEVNGHTDDGKPVCAWHQAFVPGKWTEVNEATLQPPDSRCVLCEA